MNNLPELSIITINYNGTKNTGELIESLQKHVSLPYEIIVVDNASKKMKQTFYNRNTHILSLSEAKII
jgi:Glycosyl transferase family 2.